MCWALIGVAAQVLGGAAQSGQDANTMSNNADVLDLKRTDTLSRGAVAEANQRDKTNALVGVQRAMQGASGTVVDSGSNAKIVEDTIAGGATDEATIHSNAAREAWGYQIESANLRAVAAAKEAGSLKNWLMPGGAKGTRDLMLSGGIKALPTSLGYKTPGMFGGKDNWDQSKSPLSK